MRSSIDVIAGFAGGVCAALVGLLVVPAYLRYLGPEAFGLVGFFLVLQTWILLFDLGLSPTASREMGRFLGGQHTAQGIRDLLASLERVYVAVGLLLGSVLWISAHWLVQHWVRLDALATGDAVRALSWMGIMVAAQWIGMLYRSALNGLQCQAWLGKVAAAAATGRALLTLAVLEWVSPSLGAFVLAQCAAFIVETMVLRMRLGAELPPGSGRFRREALRSVWHFAGGMSMIALLSTVVNQADKLLLARLLPLQQYGYFTLAITVVGSLSVAVSAVFNVAYARLAELVAGTAGPDLSREYHALSQIAALAVFPPALTLALLAPQAVFAWTGDARVTSEVAPIVSLWILGTTLNGILHVPYALQLAAGWVRVSIVFNALCGVLLVPALLVLVPRFGIAAAGWTWGAVNLVSFTAAVWVMHRRLLVGELRRWYLRDLGLPLAASTAAVGLCWALGALLPPSGRAASGALVAIALAAGLAAGAAATAVGRDLARSVLNGLRLRARLP